MNISGANSKMQREFHSLGYTGKDCIIAVLDTAIGEAGKLKGKIEYADSYRIDDKNTDDHASFIAGQLIDWAPDAKILSYCVFPNGSGKCGQVTVALTDLLKRVRADKNHHYFVNMSLASNLGKNIMTPYIANMHTLIQQLNAEGVPVFVAAGNDGKEELYIYPSRFQEPICVAAANADGSRSSYSTFHSEVDFIEWGTGVCNINKNGLPIMMSGTSMACPNLLGKSVLLACRMYDVSGVWPTEMQLYQEMLNCAVDCETVGYDKHTGYGFVDIRKTDGIYKVTDSFEIPVTWKNKISETITIIKNLLQKQGIVLQDAVSDTPYSKIIKFGSKGNDVKKVKDKLVELGYLHASTKYTFGSDSVAATKRFQKDNNLKVDGIVGILTWNKLFVGENTSNPEQIPENPIDLSIIPPNISRAKAAKIAADLAGVSDERRRIVLRVLPYAYDPDLKGEYPIGFYQRGGNLFNKDLSLNIMTKSKLESYLNNPNYAPYYDGGRDDMMRDASSASGYQNVGCDCSGEPVGVMRVEKLVSSGFDANANTLFSKYCTLTNNPLPGDLLHKSGHAGIYLGGGFGCEAIGGAFGIQITSVATRRVWNFVSHQFNKMSNWEHVGKWVFLHD